MFKCLIWGNSFILFKKWKFSCHVHVAGPDNVLLTRFMIMDSTENSGITLISDNWRRIFMLWSSFLVGYKPDERDPLHCTSLCTPLKLQRSHWLWEEHGIPCVIWSFLRNQVVGHQFQVSQHSVLFLSSWQNTLHSRNPTWGLWAWADVWNWSVAV